MCVPILARADKCIVELWKALRLKAEHEEKLRHSEQQYSKEIAELKSQLSKSQQLKRAEQQLADDKHASAAISSGSVDDLPFEPAAGAWSDARLTHHSPSPEPNSSGQLSASSHRATSAVPTSPVNGPSQTLSHKVNDSSTAAAQPQPHGPTTPMVRSVAECWNWCLLSVYCFLYEFIRMARSVRILQPSDITFAFLKPGPAQRPRPPPQLASVKGSESFLAPTISSIKKVC